MCYTLKERDYHVLYIASISVLTAIIVASVGVIVTGALCMTRYVCEYDGLSLILMGVIQLCLLGLFALAFQVYEYFWPAAPPPILTISPV